MDEATRELVHGWLIKAQHDLASARKLAGGPNPYLDTAIYHCQQAAEKAVKGLLVFHGQPFEKVHNIQVLIDQVLSHAAELAEWLDAAEGLTPYATLFRYPDQLVEPDPPEFEQALASAEGIYSCVLSLLPDGVHPKSD